MSNRVRSFAAVVFVSAVCTSSLFAQQASQGFVPEPKKMTQAIEFAAGHVDHDTYRSSDNGFYPELGEMRTGAGWISLGPGYRHQLLNNQLLFDVSGGVSWRSYKAAQGKLEMPTLAKGHLTIGTQTRWQDLTQVNYFGVGNDTEKSDRSQYRLRSGDVAGYASLRVHPLLTIETNGGWIDRPTISTSTGNFKRSYPETVNVYDEAGAPGIDRPVSYLHGGVSATSDTRDHVSHPMSGGLLRAAWNVYSDRDGGQFSFQRFEAEGLRAIPVVRSRWVVALHGMTAMSNTSNGKTVPFYMMPSLGGGNTLRSFRDYRFHDRNMLLASAESRVAMMDHIDFAAFVDAGSVSARARDLDLSQRSYGVGLRLHARGTTVARMDYSRGNEGPRLIFSMSDPFGLARLSRKTAPVPFVP
jgi:hypothetical protein